MSRRLLVLGCGYIGAEVCRRAPAAGWTATGIVRSEASRTRLSAEGLDVRALDVLQGDLVALGGGWDAVLVAVSAGGRGEAAYGEVFAEAPARIAAWASFVGVRSLVLLSSTGVYRQEGVVDEASTAGGDGPSDALVAGERAVIGGLSREGHVGQTCDKRLDHSSPCSATRATETTSSSAPTLNTRTPPALRERKEI
jgi:nucleoside-diphosphate-sugar epimerase